MLWYRKVIAKLYLVVRKVKCSPFENDLGHSDPRGTKATTKLLMPKIFLTLSIYITPNYIIILATKYISLAVYLGLGGDLI